MAEMTIRLRIDPNTGKKDIVIALSSDADALPHEHEEQHRKLVEKLIEGGVLKAAEVGQIIVERIEEGPQPAPATSQSDEQERGKKEAGIG